MTSPSNTGVENLEVMAEALLDDGSLRALRQPVLSDPIEQLMDFGSSSWTFSVTQQELVGSVNCTEPYEELSHRLHQRGLHRVRSLDEAAQAHFRQVCSLNVLELVEDNHGGLVRLGALLALVGMLSR